MHRRLAAVGLGVILGAHTIGAQPPQFPVAPPAQPPQFPAAPAFPMPPQFPAPPAPAQLPPLRPNGPALRPPQNPGVNTPGSPLLPAAGQSSASPEEIALPHPEQKFPISSLDVSVKRVVGGWQVWAGQKMLRDLGGNEVAARDIARVLRDLRPTEWVTIGGAKPVVEYGLTNGRPAATAAPPIDVNAGSGSAGGGGNRPAVTAAGAKVVQVIDLKTARVEPIRGVWCVRDDDTILFNCGTSKADAEQTLAVIRKYGFNRVGVVGPPAQPAMSYLFVSLEPEPRNRLRGGQLLVNAQIEALTKTGIPVPGVGFTGEMVKIDPRKVEARKDGAEWVVAAGPEVLGRFGPTEWAAREAARAVQDARFTEFCRLGGTSGLTFFLTQGKPPTRAPFNAQGRSFDPGALKVQQVNDRWAVTENGRLLFDVGSAQEGETVVRVLQSFGFDQLCHLSAGGAKGGIRFLVKNSNR
jgi:hypothetical protein